MVQHCLWIEDALKDDAGVAPNLEGETRADVCIVGGGFLGLWTAIRLKDDQPGLDVVLIEREFCGSGASGRNGGYVLSWWAKFLSLKNICGRDEALRLCKASAEAVDEIGAFCRDNEIDAHYRHDGWLWAATCKAHDGTWNAIIDELATHQLHPFERLTADEARSLARTDSDITGVFEPNSAAVQPARLARGLRRAALARGVRLYEYTPLTRLTRSTPPVVKTPKGQVRAEKVVIAMNAWAAKFAEIRKAIVVIGSDVMVTERAPDRLAEIGYTDGLRISDSRTMVSGWGNTPDGRLLMGQGGVCCLHAYGGDVGTKFDGPSTLESELHEVRTLLYPQLADVPIARSWTGPVDRTKSGLPFFGPLGGRPDIVFGVGFSGNGVGPTCMTSRILASLVQEKDDEWARCGLVRPLTRDFPPEPIRHIGVGIVRRAVAAKEAAEMSGRKPGTMTRFFAGFAPNMLASAQSIGTSTEQSTG